MTREVDELDSLLLRAHEIFLGDVTDETDEELGEILPRLVEAGYVAIDGESVSGYFWRFTPAGVTRGEELGVFDD